MIVYKNIYNFEMNILNQTYNSVNKGNTSQIALNSLFHQIQTLKTDKTTTMSRTDALSSANCAHLTLSQLQVS